MNIQVLQNNEVNWLYIILLNNSNNNCTIITTIKTKLYLLQEGKKGKKRVRNASTQSVGCKSDALTDHCSTELDAFTKCEVMRRRSVRQKK